MRHPLDFTWGGLGWTAHIDHLTDLLLHSGGRALSILITYGLDWYRFAECFALRGVMLSSGREALPIPNDCANAV
eukprot:3077376-Pyramimonas_sp.AAC.1